MVIALAIPESMRIVHGAVLKVENRMRRQGQKESLNSNEYLGPDMLYVEAHLEYSS